MHNQALKAWQYISTGRSPVCIRQSTTIALNGRNKSLLPHTFAKSKRTMQRKGAIKTLGGLALLPQVAFGKQVMGADKPVLRVAHITDVHLKNDLDAPAKFKRCLPKINFPKN